MTLLTDEDYDYYGYYPPMWHSEYRYGEELHKEELCSSCEGFGSVGFGQFHSGTKCEECDGTGLVEGTKRERLLLVKRFRSLNLGGVPNEVIERACSLVEGD